MVSVSKSKEVPLMRHGRMPTLHSEMGKVLRPRQVGGLYLLTTPLRWIVTRVESELGSRQRGRFATKNEIPPHSWGRTAKRLRGYP